jgi:hypothetical protein
MSVKRNHKRSEKAAAVVSEAVVMAVAAVVSEAVVMAAAVVSVAVVTAAIVVVAAAVIAVVIVISFIKKFINNTGGDHTPPFIFPCIQL